MTMNKRLLPICLNADATIHDAMRTINEAPILGGPSGVALVTEQDRRLLGLVTDGDIRRALVNGHTTDSKIGEVMVRDPICVPHGLSEWEMLREMTVKVRRSGRIRDTKVQYLVVLDDDRRVVDLIGLFELLEQADISSRSVTVIGLGQVGLTLAAALADVGFQVFGVEQDKCRVDLVKGGTAPFYEPGLEPLLKHQLADGQLEVGQGLPPSSDVYIIAVGTPIDAIGKPNVDHVVSAVRSIGKKLKKGDLVALRSTVPVGSSRCVVLPLLESESHLQCGADFSLVFAPERMVEGDALKELTCLPQIIGGFDARSVETATRFFSKLAPSIVRVDSLESAEMAKLINNTHRDVSFAFANELAMICDHWNLDAVKVIEAANMGYPRNPIPLPSPGVGGLCLTKDPRIFTHAGITKGFEPRLAAVGRSVNEQMIEHVGRKVFEFFARHKKDPARSKVFVLGFAFKGSPETSDTRDSPTLELLPMLQKAGFHILGFDPVVRREELASFGVTPMNITEGFAETDAVLIMTNHPKYRDIDLFRLLPTMRKPAMFFDGWHMFARRDIENVSGVEYVGLSGNV